MISEGAWRHFFFPKPACTPRKQQAGSQTKFDNRKDHESSLERRQNSVLSLDPNLLHVEEVGAGWPLRKLGVSLLSNAALEDGPKSEAVAYAEAVVTEMSMSVDELVSCGLPEDNVLSEHKKERHLHLQPPFQALLMKSVVGCDLDAYQFDVLAPAKQLEP
jgi:hypothetical protein